MVVAEDHLAVAEEAEEDKQPVLTFNFEIKLKPTKYEKYIFLLALGAIHKQCQITRHL
jgi:hypothetical protein